MQTLVPDRVKQRIHAMWNKVAELGANGTDEALRLILSELTELLDAHYSWWLGSLRVSEDFEGDPASGWRPRAIYNLHPSPERERAKKEHTRRLERGEVHQGLVANLRRAGHFRVTVMHELVPQSWFSSDYYEELYKPFEMRDCIFVVTPINESVESWMAFERNGFDKPLYDDYERELLDYAIRPMKWFHRQLVLRHGVHLAEEPLQESERRVLNGLLTNKTESEIAEEVNLSPSTVHTYCTRIYRKFGVRGRAGLMAMWLGQVSEALV